MIRFGINGFGRIGRCITRLWLENPELQKKIQLVQINSPSGGEIGAHLLKYDSVHGVVNKPVTWQAPFMSIDSHKVLFTQHRELTAMDWPDLDVVLECSGRYKEKNDLAQHLSHGAKKVILSSPGKEIDKTIVYGVNHHNISAEDNIVSAASCTTNCLAPLLNVILEKRKILTGFMTTIHAYTTDQNLTDASHKDYRRARAASQSMVPTKTGAASTIGAVIPALAGCLDGIAVRVPTANVSLLDIVLNLDEPIEKKALNELFQTASKSSLNGILGYNEVPLVSCDFNQRRESSIIDGTQTMVNGCTVKLMAWYDNEWAFADRMLDLMLCMTTNDIQTKEISSEA